MKERALKVRMPKPHRPAHPGVPALEWFREASGRTVRITAIGSRQVLIENHTGILDFSGEQVELSAIDGRLRVQGQNLTLSEVRENALIIRGCIRRVDLPGEETFQ